MAAALAVAEVAHRPEDPLRRGVERACGLLARIWDALPEGDEEGLHPETMRMLLGSVETELRKALERTEVQ